MVEEIIFLLTVSFLVYGNLIYQFARLGYLNRQHRHRPASIEELDRILESPAPPLTLLIPSYREEKRVIEQALFSTALQEYPNRRVVLLIDDPPNPRNPVDLASLEEARLLPQAVQNVLQLQAKPLRGALARFKERSRGTIDSREEYRRLSGLYRDVSRWFEEQALKYPIQDHTDQWFIKNVFLARARMHRDRASQMASHARRPQSPRDQGGVAREYLRLSSLFEVTVTSFERKQYENLSHEPNKAMNLNSYIGLIGKSFLQREEEGLLYLEPVESGDSGVTFPDAEYIITLDADSLLLPEYAIRLITIMQKPGNERLAVAQTPYNAVPGPAGILERIAGATTDIQYIIHQGFTSHGATYWVGANALLRKVALDDIQTPDQERGYPIFRYIQDRTVIEDTESSIDLVARGWKLYNYPDRLSYSATPPDYGSLLIQRRRWANGGLIIMPKLIRYLFRSPLRFRKIKEGAMRFHYLTSITGVNVGLVFMLLYPFDENLRNIWLPLSSLSYYFFYGRDLRHSGYKGTDLLKVYALNLLLVPINLGGVLKSLHQACTGQKIAFKRTPKIMGRTSAPGFYIAAEVAIVFYCLTGSMVDSYYDRWLHAAFAFTNGLFFLYGIIIFMGLRPCAEDLLHTWRSSRLRPFLLSMMTAVALPFH